MVDDVDSSLNNMGLQKSSLLRKAQTVFTLLFITVALLGGLLADVGFGQHSSEKTCLDSENTFEKIGIALVFASFYCLGINIVFFLVRLLLNWKASIHALALVLLHAGCVFLTVVIFADALLSNAGCGVAAFASISPEPPGFI